LISPFTHQIPLILLFKIPKSHGLLTNFLCLILCIFVVTEYVYIERMHIVMLYHAFLNSWDLGNWYFVVFAEECGLSLRYFRFKHFRLHW
jgi:hypothetical protein